MSLAGALLFFARVMRRLNKALAVVSVIACMGSPKMVKSKVNNPMRAKEKPRARVQRRGQKAKMTSQTPTYAAPFRVMVGNAFLAFNALGVARIDKAPHVFQALGDAVLWARAVSASHGTASPDVAILDSVGRSVAPWPDDAPLGRDKFVATVDLERLRAALRTTPPEAPSPNRADAMETVTFALRNVLAGHFGENLSHALIEVLVKELATEATDSPCAWAFAQAARSR